MNTVSYGFEYQVQKVKDLLSALSTKNEKLDYTKIQLLMNRHNMPTGYNRAMKVYDKLIEEGFLVRDKNNLGAYIKGGEK